MENMKFQLGPKNKPDLHVNNPPEKKLWQRQGPFSIWYFIVMLMLLYFFQSGLQVKNEEIPYSQFQNFWPPKTNF